jgi:C1A family cysteine protease
MKHWRMPIWPIIVVILIISLAEAGLAITLEDVRAALATRKLDWIAEKTFISDLSEDQFKARLGAVPEMHREKGPFHISVPTAPPSHFDWRELNKVSSVKDQGDCGSCWAFSTVAALESLALIKSVSPVMDASEQFLVSYDISNFGCNGGGLGRAARFLDQNGTIDERCLEYRADDNIQPFPCRKWGDSRIGITSSSWIVHSVESLKEAVYEAPVAATFLIFEDFKYYTSGIYEYVSGSYLGAHGILVVGWDDVGKYFIVKNSWGEAWGEEGFFRIAYSQVTNEVQLGADAIIFEGLWTLP